MTLVAPFPYFGGKRAVAEEVWRRFGLVDNYVEPFFGSGAVLLARPSVRGVETVNDADGFVSNFWRAVRADPDEVAQWCDWPVSEADLHARHYWLVTEGRDRLASLLGNPDGYDAKVAGWWVWGICAWIGSGWCSGDGPWQWDGNSWVKNGGQGIRRQLPHLGSGGRGINRRLPHLGAGAGDIVGWMLALANRLRHVRIAHGDWTRVLGDSATWLRGKTAVFLDPPYALTERDSVYAVEADVSSAVREWAIQAGKRSDMLVCLAGYDGEHAMPSDWVAYRWKAHGGYGVQGSGRGRINVGRETLWFSPACEPACIGRLL